MTPAATCSTGPSCASTATPTRSWRQGAPGRRGLPHRRAHVLLPGARWFPAGRCAPLDFDPHVEAGHPEGFARGADAAPVRGRRPAGAPRVEPRLPRHDRRRPHRPRQRAATPGDPDLRPGRAVRPGDHRPGLDRRERQRRRGPHRPELRQDRHGARHDDRARRAQRAPREHRRRDAAELAHLHRVRAHSPSGTSPTWASR